MIIHSNQRLESRVATDSSQTTLMGFGYNYDNSGNILSLTDSTLGESTTYTYDGLNRLKSCLGCSRIPGYLPANF